jgi:hypothetical protein
MTADQLLQWMAAHRVPSPGCSRCGAASEHYWRDGLERPICDPCAAEARDAADDTARRIARRLAELVAPAHDCPAEGCLVCQP